MIHFHLNDNYLKNKSYHNPFYFLYQLNLYLFEIVFYQYYNKQVEDVK